MRLLFGIATIVACMCLGGCLVGGYSSGSGFWIWPGSLVLTVLLALWFLLSRR